MRYRHASWINKSYYKFHEIRINQDRLECTLVYGMKLWVEICLKALFMYSERYFSVHNRSLQIRNQFDNFDRFLMI
jgi:hypothetical protein